MLNAATRGSYKLKVWNSHGYWVYEIFAKKWCLFWRHIGTAYSPQYITSIIYNHMQGLSDEAQRGH